MKKHILFFCLFIFISNYASANIFKIKEVFDKVNSKEGKAALKVVKTLISLDEDEEIEIGKVASLMLIDKFGLYNNQVAEKYVNMVGAVLVENCERANLKFHFNILNTDSVNAFACPGGFIFITRGALNLAQNEDELAAILAHEIAHITLKHEVKEIKKSNILKELASLYAEKNDAVVQALADFVVNNLLVKGRNRQDEFEADAHSLNYMRNHNYYPLLNFYLARLNTENEKNPSKLEYLTKTHPPLNERIQKLAGSSDFEGSDMELRKTRFDFIKNVTEHN